jgi:hypothetical protein
MTRKQFLMAFFAAPLAALGVKQKQRPVGLRLLRDYDVIRGQWVVRFEELMLEQNLRFHREAFAFEWHHGSRAHPAILEWPKEGETVQVRTLTAHLSPHWS